MEDVPSQAGPIKSARRNVSHISRACLQCRRRKIRCDGKQPACTACISAQQESGCQYSSGADGRKLGAAVRSAAARQRANSRPEDSVQELRKKNDGLRAKLLLLEGALTRRGISIMEALDDVATPEPHNIPRQASRSFSYAESETVSGSEEWQSSSGMNAANADPLQETMATDMDHLHMDDPSSSTLYHYGPTSALNHLNSAPQHLQSPLSDVRTAPRHDAFALQDTIDWARNLPDVTITRDVHDCILDLAEAFFTPWCWVVNFYAFKRDMQLCLGLDPGTQEARPARTPFYSPLLHNAILAIGASLYCGERIISPLQDSAVAPVKGSRCAEEALADSFAVKARECFDIECERPMQSTVNGLLLIASFNSGRARPNLGHVFFNCAATTSHTLGVNIDCSSFVKRGVISEETKVAREQLFWTVYCQDKLWSMAVGRFTNISPDDHNVSQPPIDDFLDQQPWRAPSVWADLPIAGMATANGRPGWVSTCADATRRLAVVQSAILRKYYSLKSAVRHPRQADAIAEVQKRLTDWYDNLAEPLRLSSIQALPPHVLTLHITYQYTVILLLRPFYQTLALESITNTLVKDCDLAALRVVELLGLYDKCYGLSYAPLSSIQTTFVAGTMHLLKALQAARLRDEPACRSAVQGAEICILSLDKMGITWSSASRVSQILQSLLKQWFPGHHSRDDLASAPSSYSAAPTYTGQPAASSHIEAMPGLNTAGTSDSTVGMHSGAYVNSTSSLDSVLAYLNSGNAAMQPDAVPEPTAGMPSPQHGSIPASSQFLHQLLNHQQYEAQPQSEPTSGEVDYSMFDRGFEPSNTNLSSFDFAIGGFEDLLQGEWGGDNW